ncbi:MAG: TIM-barrel domain-containing protein [Ginsengibacter sp.]
MKKLFLFIFLFSFFQISIAQKIQNVAPGIWKISYGVPEKHLPTEFKENPLTDSLKKLPASQTPPFDLHSFHFSEMPSGVLAEMNVDSSERFYGFGLQINSFEQRGMRREIRTNSWPVGNVGFSHAPMPFYISSRGYGVLVNTSRYTIFYMASKGKLDKHLQNAPKDSSGKIALNTVTLYGKKYSRSGEVSILTEGTKGVEIYVLAGPTMMNVMQRYNLFSGGGALPPMWGLGFEYRNKATFADKQVLQTADYFRSHDIPCDMFGLEPGWQSASYSCSFKWNKNNFPNPDSFVNKINAEGFKINLWEHAYTNPSSPIFNAIVPYSGNYTVWAGAVPDFILPQTQKIFGGYHEKTFVKKGIAAFKLDECDAADYSKADREWSFPDIAQFPSGIDGIQMRQIFGYLYQKTMLNLYRKNDRRTLFDVRASYLFASPFTSVLYSDMHDLHDYVRMIVNSGFAGVNWSPELRETSSDTELIRRMQTTLMSSHMVANCWYLDLPPWLQYNTDKNVKHELLPNAKQLEASAKKLIDLRMSLLPYLYSAFAEYHFNGTPPFRALVLDYPNDPDVWRIDDEYMMGRNILCAPFIDTALSRTIYFPEGTWYDFNTNKKYEGGKSYLVKMSLDQIPMFVKANTILPLADPVEFVAPSTVFNVRCKVYGNDPQPFRLFEDNSFNFDFVKGKYNWITLFAKGQKIITKRTGSYPGHLYTINENAETTQGVQ